MGKEEWDLTNSIVLKEKKTNGDHWIIPKTVVAKMTRGAWTETIKKALQEDEHKVHKAESHQEATLKQLKKEEDARTDWGTPKVAEKSLFTRLWEQVYTWNMNGKGDR